MSSWASSFKILLHVDQQKVVESLKQERRQLFMYRG